MAMLLALRHQPTRRSINTFLRTAESGEAAMRSLECGGGLRVGIHLAIVVILMTALLLMAHTVIPPL